MPSSVAGSASAAAERTAAKLDAIRSKMPSSSKAVRVEAKYDVVLDYPNLELHSAAASGNVGLVHYALTHGQPVNSLLHGCLPLHAASSGGNVTVVRMLIERGADVNAPRLPRRYSDNKRSSNMPAVGTAGSTPLHFAAANGHPAVVQLLLACGAFADKPDKNGLRPEDLAELSGHTSVVHTIRVWRQMNENTQSPPTASEDQRNSEAGPSRRVRRSSISSSQWTGSDTGGETPNLAMTPAVTSRRSIDRASSVVSAASEKGMSRLRTSLDSVRGGVRLAPIKTAFAKQQAQQGPPQPSTPHRQTSEPFTPRLLVTNSTPPQAEPFMDGPVFGSPPNDGWLSSEPDEATHFNVTRTLSPVSVDSMETDQQGYPQRSSRRPSLPSIVEKAGGPKNSSRASIQQNGNESSPSITESPTPTSPLASTTTLSTGGSNGSSFFRGRSRNTDRRINKQAILGLFRRGVSPHSRSPSPPRKTEPTRPIDVDEVDANVARLKRASMDPELMRMAMDAAALSDQLESSATVSAPVTKTRFFEDYAQRNTSTQSLSSGPAPVDRLWDRRKHSGVMSPSPLAREWSGADDDQVPKIGIRRTRTEVRRVSPSAGIPRRMPSEPQLAATATLTRSRSMGTYGNRAVSDPASLSSTPVDSPLPAPSDAEVADDEAEDIIESAMPSIEALAASRNKETTPDETTPEETEEENDQLTIPLASEVPAFNLEAAGESELMPSAEIEDLDNTSPTNLATTGGRFRGESIGSTTTESSRGLRTPPSSQVTPPGHAVGRRESDVSDIAPCPLSPPEKPRPTTRSRGHSETSMVSILASGFPPVPEHEHEEGDQQPRPRPRPRPPRPVRKISSHAEARDMVRATERGVLELAQMPMTEDSTRSLADQLAAYGESHAIAEEFARAERMSSLSSGSERNSVASSDSARRAARPVSFTAIPSNRGNRMLSRSPPTVYSGSVPAIGKIYDLREQAYRDRMQALTSSTPIYGMRSTVQRSRTVSGEHTGHRRATTTSDSWLTVGPNSALNKRRLTDPSSQVGVPLESNPHISTPLPMLSDPLGIRPSQKNRTRSAVSARPQMPSALKVPGGHQRTGSAGLGRSVSLHRPNDKVNSVRYQGLAQARSFAASSAQQPFVLGHTRVSSDGYGLPPNAHREREPGHGHQQSHSHGHVYGEHFPERLKEYSGANDWRPDASREYAPLETAAAAERGSRWGQLKGAIGNLRRT